MWQSPEPKKTYDVIIVGGGGHGLGTAYYLAKEHGIKNIAVIEKGWLGLIDSGALAPYAKFEGDKSTASWYPNQEVANAWINFAFQSQKQPR